MYLFYQKKIPFGLDKNNFEHIRFIPFVVALWFLIFSMPMIYYFKKKLSNDESSDETQSLKKFLK